MENEAQEPLALILASLAAVLDLHLCTIRGESRSGHVRRSGLDLLVESNYASDGGGRKRQLVVPDRYSSLQLLARGNAESA